MTYESSGPDEDFMFLVGAHRHLPEDWTMWPKERRAAAAAAFCEARHESIAKRHRSEPVSATSSEGAR